MKLIKSIALTASVFAFNAHIGTALAADEYQIDQSHTWVSFTINHAGWANAHGKFKKVSGKIKFDEKNIAKSSVQVSIDAKSLDTNSSQRDRDMAGPDFLNSGEFPTIKFKSVQVEKTGDKTAKVHGYLSLAGVTKPVTLATQWNAEFPLPWDPTTIKTGFSANTTINGVDFGMNKLVEFGLGPEIHIDIDAEAIKQ